MAITPKRRAVVSFENMSDELAAAFSEKYPRGYADYFQDIQEYPKKDGTKFYAVTMEIPDAIYLVKVKVKTDDAEDIQRWLEGEDENRENEESDTSSETSSSSLPDSDISQYSSAEGGEDDS